MKICTKCGVKKADDQFHKCKVSKDGLYQWCKECKIEYDKKYRKGPKVVAHQLSDEYRDHKKKYRDRNYIETKLSAARARAQKEKGDDYFSITKDDLQYPEFCPLLGTKLKYVTDERINANGASIDRIDNSKGYVPGNVWIISSLANTMKSKATKEQLITFAENILKYFKD